MNSGQRKRSFIEVFAKCPIQVLAQRNVKGLYKKALAGEIKEFTGVSDPYEEPDNPEVVVETDRQTMDQGVREILTHLTRRGLVQVRAQPSPTGLQIGLEDAFGAA